MGLLTSDWSNPLNGLTKEERDIFYEFGGKDNQNVFFTAVVLFVNLVKRLREKGVV